MLNINNEKDHHHTKILGVMIDDQLIWTHHVTVRWQRNRYKRRGYFHFNLCEKMAWTCNYNSQIFLDVIIHSYQNISGRDSIMNEYYIQ